MSNYSVYPYNSGPEILEGSVQGERFLSHSLYSIYRRKALPAPCPLVLARHTSLDKQRQAKARSGSEMKHNNMGLHKKGTVDSGTVNSGRNFRPSHSLPLPLQQFSSTPETTFPHQRRNKHKSVESSKTCKKEKNKKILVSCYGKRKERE